jgi:adenine C2-methylase RlmN of 23S rRNA A2503 and tRNA A37
MRVITRSPGFLLIVTRHAGLRMAEHDVAKFEVDRVVKAGAVIMIETEPNGTEKWRVAGVSAGRRIEVVIQPLAPRKMVLVTVIRVG